MKIGVFGHEQSKKALEAHFKATDVEAEYLLQQAQINSTVARERFRKMAAVVEGRLKGEPRGGVRVLGKTKIK